jgi:hypothetical protein
VRLAVSFLNNRALSDLRPPAGQDRVPCSSRVPAYPVLAANQRPGGVCSPGRGCHLPVAPRRVPLAAFEPVTVVRLPQTMFRALAAVVAPQTTFEPQTMFDRSRTCTLDPWVLCHLLGFRPASAETGSSHAPTRVTSRRAIPAVRAPG